MKSTLTNNPAFQASTNKTDLDVIRENHRFLWDDDDGTESWEQQLARKYYSKLFHEYCICDLTRYKENKIAMRWRTEAEVIAGAGQFICGNKHCAETEELRSWEVNFTYAEKGTKKSALVKLRLCTSCSKKLNYHSTKRLVKKQKKRLKENKPYSPSPSITVPSPKTSSNDQDTIVNHNDPESEEMVANESATNQTNGGNVWSEKGKKH